MKVSKQRASLHFLKKMTIANSKFINTSPGVGRSPEIEILPKKPRLQNRGFFKQEKGAR